MLQIPSADIYFYIYFYFIRLITYYGRTSNYFRLCIIYHCTKAYCILSTMFTLHFKCIMQSKEPNIGQLWAEIFLIEAARIVYCLCPLSLPFYSPRLFREIPTTSVCYLFMKYTWVSLWIVFSLIRILAAQRTYAWICWNHRRNACFCIGNPPLHIDREANKLFSIFLIFWIALLFLLLFFVCCFPIVFAPIPCVLHSEE